jgi:hypothetical protein
MGEKEIPIETFDALLRDLVTWDLVVPSEGDDAQAWHLVARAQQRLGDLAATRGPWPAGARLTRAGNVPTAAGDS